MISIRRASNTEDFAAAAALIGELQQWIQHHLGVDVTEHQPAFATELAALDEHYATADAAIFLGFDGTVPAGCIAVRCAPDGTAELKRMYVRPQARRLGLGDTLVRCVITFAERRGCRSMWLETAQGAMDAAIALYARHGFAIVAEPSSLAIDHVVVMRRPLNPTLWPVLHPVSDTGCNGRVGGAVATRAVAGRPSVLSVASADRRTGS